MFNYTTFYSSYNILRSSYYSFNFNWHLSYSFLSTVTNFTFHSNFLSHHPKVRVSCKFFIVRALATKLVRKMLKKIYLFIY